MWLRTATLGGSELRKGPSEAEGVRAQAEGWPGIPGLHLPAGSCMTLDKKVLTFLDLGNPPADIVSHKCYLQLCHAAGQMF